MPTAVTMARKVLGLPPEPEPEPTETPPKPAAETGFQISRSRGRRTSTLTRWGVRVIVGLLLWAGVNQVVVKPLAGAFGGDTTPPAAVIGPTAMNSATSSLDTGDDPSPTERRAMSL